MSNSSRMSGGRCNPNRPCSFESVEESMVSLSICLALLGCVFVLRAVVGKILSGDCGGVRMSRSAIRGSSDQPFSVLCSPLQERAAIGLEISSIRGTHHHGKSMWCQNSLPRLKKWRGSALILQSVLNSICGTERTIPITKQNFRLLQVQFLPVCNAATTMLSLGVKCQPW